MDFLKHNFKWYKNEKNTKAFLKLFTFYVKSNNNGIYNYKDLSLRHAYYVAFD